MKLKGKTYKAAVHISSSFMNEWSFDPSSKGQKSYKTCDGMYAGFMPQKIWGQYSVSVGVLLAEYECSANVLTLIFYFPSKWIFIS